MTKPASIPLSSLAKVEQAENVEFVTDAMLSLGRGEDSSGQRYRVCITHFRVALQVLSVEHKDTKQQLQYPNKIL